MKLFLYYALIIDLIIADQLSKWAVSEYIIRDGEAIGLIDWALNAPERLGASSIEMLPFFNLVMVWNEGISFGLFNNGNGNTALPLILFSLIVSGGFLVWLSRVTHPLQKTGLALVIGGALGNVIDRVRFGAVMDFLDIHVMGYHWPAFNIADSAIVIGVVCLMVHALFFENKEHSA